MSFPLGPALGQCCGGFVRVMLERWDGCATSGFAEGIRPRGSDPGNANFDVSATGGFATGVTALAHWQDACGSGERRPVLDTSAPRLVLTPLVCGLAPLPIAVRDELAAYAIPLRVGREAARMLSGERPATTLTVKGREGGSDWLIEPVADHRHRLTLYGAGHVGRAIVRVMADLPFDIAWVDTGPERFEGAAMFGATPVVVTDPAAHAATAPAGGFHLVLTYSHPLDLAICQALLSRNDFAFLGLIGSATKRARFIRRLVDAGIPASAIARLTSPIGVVTLTGKSPAVIAIAVATQLVETIEAMAQRKNDHQHVGTTARTT